MAKPLRTVLGVVAISVGAALIGFGVARFFHAPATVTPMASREFVLRDLAGKTHRLADWRGKVVLLNFWATWCPPCRREIPLFIELQQKHEKAGLQIVGIAVDNPEAVARYWQEMHMNYPVLLADNNAFDLMTAYGNPEGALPYSVVIAPDGKVVAAKLGAYESAELEMLLNPLLNGSRTVTN
jgi:thiol-disulfide isomerase/thioredoxin